MKKMFVYSVNGTTFEDTVAFGEAWEKAEKQAKKEHTYITRQVICGDNIRNEIFCKGIFLSDNGNRNPYIF